MSDQIIPSLDRGMYHWDGTKLSQLPFTADDLVDQAHLHTTQHSILAGAKANDIVGITIHTGKVSVSFLLQAELQGIVREVFTLTQPIYECTHQKCHRYDNQSLIQRMDVLKLSTSRVTVRGASDLTGEEL